MIPVTQTKVVVKKSTGETVARGNCYAACIASILEKTIDEIPNVETLFHIDDTYWSIVMHTYLRSIGWEIMTNDEFKVFHDESFGVENGKRSEWIGNCENRLYMVSGQSPRGVMHCVIYKNGNMVWDPHPTREGILTQEYFEELTQTNENIST